jgi:hypothetical protein
MGQIQNAVLNTLGSVQQMAQLYKLTDAYTEGQRKKSAAAAKKAAEEQAKQKYEDAEAERLKGRTSQQMLADTMAVPYSEEENANYKNMYRDLYSNEISDKQKKDTLSKAKRKLTQSITNYPGEQTDPKYTEYLRERQWLENNEDFKYLYASKDSKEKAQKSPQEQADTNDNIKKAKKAAKGGKK